MKRTIALAAALAFAVAACGDDGPTGPGGNDNELTATVGGVAFDSPNPGGSYTAAQGLVVISGSQISGGVTTTVSITRLGVNGTGTYELSPNAPGSFGQVAIFQNGSTAQWTTILSPGTGSLTINTLTADRLAGTFQFTAQAAPGTPATGQKTVTSGTFDIDL
jgi:hypothetical protein